MASTSPVIIVCFFATLLQGTVHALDSCEPEGSIQLAVNDTQEYIDNNNRTYHLLQVCLFGHWSYVCGANFGHNNNDRFVTLYQLGCTEGVTENFNVNSPLPVYLINIGCVGVERRLADCRRGTINNITDCNTRVGAYCTEYGNFTCQNGELQMDNITNALYICFNGGWRTLCYNEYFWGPTQATVACRELNPGKMVTNASVTGLSGLTGTPTILHRNFQCAGDEARLRDCVSSTIHHIICGNRRVGLVCETDDMMSVDKPQPAVSTVMLTSTQTVTFTPLCSMLIMSTTSLSEASSCNVLISTTTVVSTPLCTAQERVEPQLGASPVNTTPVSCFHTSPAPCSHTTLVSCSHASPVPCSHTTPVSTSSLPWVDGGIPLSSSPLPWVGGGIIGVVLSTAILLTVLAAVCLLRRRKRRRTHSQNTTSTTVLDGGSASPVLTNHSIELYCDSTMQANRWPQPYEVSQPEPEYSYATHAVDVTTYDNVAHDENGGCDGNTKKRVHVIDNSPLYSLCDEETSEDEMYTKMD